MTNIETQEATIVAKNPKTARFSEAPWFSPGIEVIIGGAGGIGSWLSLFLARQEAYIYLYDFDEVSEVNMAGQLYSQDQIGETKAQAVYENVLDFCGHSQIDQMGVYEKDSMVNRYTFSAFDNMEARKLMFEKWVEAFKDEADAIFIDGRMLAEQGQIYFVTKDKIEAYRATLFEDSESPLENCSYKATSHCGALISSLIVSGFNNFITNIKSGQDIRDIPFSIIYELPLINFDVK